MILTKSCKLNSQPVQQNFASLKKFIEVFHVARKNLVKFSCIRQNICFKLPESWKILESSLMVFLATSAKLCVKLTYRSWENTKASLVIDCKPLLIFVHVEVNESDFLGVGSFNRSRKKCTYVGRKFLQQLHRLDFKYDRDSFLCVDVLLVEIQGESRNPHGDRVCSGHGQDVDTNSDRRELQTRRMARFIHWLATKIYTCYQI